MEQLLTKELPPEETIELTSPGVYSFLHYLVSTGANLPSYWTPERDKFLRREAIKNGFLSSSVWVVLLKLFGIPFKVQSTNSTIAAHLKLSTEYNRILQQSINNVLEQFLLDLLICDNGAFLLVDGFEPSDQPLSSLPTGLRHLDSNFCQRTGDSTYPVVYHHSNNQSYLIHESRLISIVQNKSSDRDMNGVGLSFVTRCFLLAQHLLDIAQYEAESLGSRSSEEIIWATGSSSKDVEGAFLKADLDSDNAGLLRVGKRVYMGFRDPNAKVGKLMLKNLPDNFQKRDDIEITLTLLALASGGQSTWFFDSVKSGSTKASAAESTKIGDSKIVSWWITKFVSELEQKFLPSGNVLQIISGYDELDFDGTKSTIRLNDSKTRQTNLLTKVTNIRIERELQLKRGEISEQQFNYLELEDGRLPNGLPIYTIFLSNEVSVRKLLYMVTDPLDFENNDPITILPLIKEYKNTAISMALNGKTNLTQENGKIAMYALQWLENQYSITPNEQSVETDFNVDLENVGNMAQATDPETFLTESQLRNKTNETISI